MTYIPKIHHWISDEKNYLGFVGVNVFNHATDNFDILKAISEGLLNDQHFSREISSNTEPTNYYGPIRLDELEINDFTIVESGELEICFQKFWEESNWNDDLIVFKDHKQKVDDYLSSIEFNPTKHYFLCKNWLTENKLIPETDFFVYVVCVVSISLDKVVVTTYGED